MADTITVSSAQELESAYSVLSKSSGGTIRIAEGVTIGEVSLSGGGGSNVTVTSADPTKLSQVTSFVFKDVSNVTLDALHFEMGTGRHLTITGSEGITVSNSSFQSDASNMITYDVGGYGSAVGLITNSDGIVFDNNTFSDHWSGLHLTSTTNVRISGNEFSGFQADSIQMESVQGVTIENNHFHDFYGSSQDRNHSDMIQVHSSNYDVPTKDLTIAGNIFDAGEGAGYQSIFIGNENYGATFEHHENIVVQDNVIYNAMYGGIRIGRTDGLIVTNNTVLHNQDAEVLSTTGGNTYSHTPVIRLDKNLNLTAEDNIASQVVADGKSLSDTNAIISYRSSNSNFVDNHFVGATKGENATLEDLQLKEDSAFVGMGASATQPGGTYFISESSSAATLPPVPAELGLGTTEAEALDLDGYDVNTNPGASSDALIRTTDAGTASGVFSGDAGSYFIDVTWFDEPDGVSNFALLVDGVEVSQWAGLGDGLGDIVNLPSGEPMITETERVGIWLEGGEEITILGTRSEGEYARVDSVTIWNAEEAPELATVADEPVEEVPVEEEVVPEPVENEEQEGLEQTVELALESPDDPSETVETDNASDIDSTTEEDPKSFFQAIIDFIKDLFGLDGDDTPVAARATDVHSQSEELVMLSDIVPETGTLDEEIPEEGEEEYVDLALAS